MSQKQSNYSMENCMQCLKRTFCHYIYQQNVKSSCSPVLYIFLTVGKCISPQLTNCKIPVSKFRHQSSSGKDIWLTVSLPAVDGANLQWKIYTWQIWLHFVLCNDKSCTGYLYLPVKVTILWQYYGHNFFQDKTRHQNKGCPSKIQDKWSLKS